MKEYIKHVNYQVWIWKCAHIPQPDIPDPTDGHGWIAENGLMELKWSGKDILPVELVDILDTIDQDEAESDSEGEGTDGDSDTSDEDTDDESDSDF